MPPKSKKARFSDHCQVCGATSTHLYRHMLRVHLPWYLDPTTACVDCHMSAGAGRDLQAVHGGHQLFRGESLLQAWFLLMNGLFLFLSQGLGLGSPMGLLGCAVMQELLPGPLRFSEEELFFLREYDRRAGLEPLPLGGYIVTPPTRLIALMHPALMTKLIVHLDHEAITQLKSYTKYALFDPDLPECSILPIGYPTVKRGIIDAHFHLDKLSDHKDISLSDLESSKSLPIRVPFAIANYVFPSSWKYLSDNVRSDPRLRITLGVHPHMITDSEVDSLFGRLRELVNQNPGAVGIGEVGLDMTTECRHGKRHNKRHCRDQKLQGQRRFLRLALQLAKYHNRVLVLHTRDKGTGEAAREVLTLLLELGMFDHPIHRHCFIGGEEEYRQWTSSLPNCYFSISPATVKDPKTMHALSLLDNRHRLVLETDSPYMADFRYPWDVYKVAKGAAQSLDMTLTELVGVCNKNVARLYNLPW